ncbi:MAG: diaminopimelate epimerase, partial [Bacteroidota bacterium]
MEQNFFIKSHGLGNDYIFLDNQFLTFKLSSESIKRICDVHYGIGSDGILLLIPSDRADFGLRIFNPDGSEAEKSGNGLRIFAKTLFDEGYTKQKKFTIDTPGGIARAHITAETNNKASRIAV